jgi:hypothetical protein
MQKLSVASSTCLGGVNVRCSGMPIEERKENASQIMTAMVTKT